MSKRQEKIEQRRAEQHAFVKERRKYQVAMLEHAYNVGLKLYEDNKDKLSEEEIAKIESMKAEQLATLEKLKAEIGEVNTNPEA